MGRPPRIDYPGAWLHIVNRGIARRPVFETATDVASFCGLLEAQVASGLLEVHAFSVLTTHFHLLGRSPEGRISEAMRRVENGFVRTFNRRRRRDGSLFRGRFTSRLVESESHWGATLWYIDRNPIAAGLVSRSTDYPHGSAHHYSRPSGPPWLTRTVVERFVAAWLGIPRFCPGLYPARVGGEDLVWVESLVARRLRSRGGEPDPLDDLVRGAPEAVREWMQRKALLADGTRAGLALVSPERVLREVEATRKGPPVPDGGDREAEEALLTGLLRTACGVSSLELTERLSLGPSQVRRRSELHHRRILHDPDYLNRATAILIACIQAEAGRIPRGSIPLVPKHRQEDTPGAFPKVFPPSPGTNPPRLCV